MLPVAIGNPYLQNVYQGGRQRATIEFQRFSTNMVEQHQKRHSNKESVLLQKKLRSYAGHDPPLFRTSGKVQTKSFRTFVLKGYLQSPLSTVQTSINLLLKIKETEIENESPIFKYAWQALLHLQTIAGFWHKEVWSQYQTYDPGMAYGFAIAHAYTLYNEYAFS